MLKEKKLKFYLLFRIFCDREMWHLLLLFRCCDPEASFVLFFKEKEGKRERTPSHHQPLDFSVAWIVITSASSIYPCESH